MRLGQLGKGFTHQFVVEFLWLVAVHRPAQVASSTGTAEVQPMLAVDTGDKLAFVGWPCNVFVMTSFRVCSSGLNSAIIRSRRLCSASRPMRRRTPDVSMPPNVVFQLENVAALIPLLRQMPETGRPAAALLSILTICVTGNRDFRIAPAWGGLTEISTSRGSSFKGRLQTSS